MTINTGANITYPKLAVQWFASVWFSRQRFPRWIRTQSEYPTVSYRKTVGRHPKRRPSRQNRLTIN